MWYDDGTLLAEGTSLARDIDWSQVVRVRFESQWDTYNVDVTGLRDMYRLSLQKRVVKTVGHGTVRVSMLIISKLNEPVNEETTEKVIYWFPHGIVHECTHFRCVEVSTAAQQISMGNQAGLKIIHGATTVKSDLLLV